MINLTEAAEFATGLAREAGAIMKQNFALGMAKEWKEDNSPLTITDQTINTLVLSKLRAEYPEHSIVSEEGSELTDFEYTWVCDPVDGTMPFSHGYPTFCFSLALTHNGESILGVVYDPMCDRMFTAVQGKGAYMNGTKISVSPEEALSKKSILGFDGESALPKLSLFVCIHRHAGRRG
jgi:fructose-1,6-bisphosphatase/inositol monophosphatase family enzyme